MTKKIMVVDDEPDIQLFMMAALEDNGFLTCTLSNDEDVTEALISKKPDILVLDYMMPKRSGISICKEIRGNTKFDKMPIIMISAVVSSRPSEQGDFKKLFTDYNIPVPEAIMEKPIVLPELLKRIDELLAEKT